MITAGVQPESRNIRLVIEYDGTGFHGWQSQPDLKTVQGECTAALEKITGEKVRLIGASRTDQGVHATGQVANFRTKSGLDRLALRRALNALLETAIHVKSVDEVGDGFHSRFSARSKIYVYKIIRHRSPFLMRYNWWFKHDLDTGSCRSVIGRFAGEHDFSHFSCQDDRDSTRCRIINIDLAASDGQITITIEADRFLRKMARGIVGFVAEVGRGRFSPSDVEKAFRGAVKDPFFAPPQGLCLTAVNY